MPPNGIPQVRRWQPFRWSVLLIALLSLGACESTSPDPSAEQPLVNDTSNQDQSCVTTGCDDGDACTVDTCDLFAGVHSCTHVPVRCDDGRTCDPDSGECVECFVDADCDDGQFCSGTEVCNAGDCEAGASPCGNLQCDETNDSCENCINNSDCDDGVFCNGAEQCIENACAPGEPPCPEECDEALASCGGALTARILGCESSDIYFDFPLPLGAQVIGGFGERTDIVWTIEAEHATISSTSSNTTTLLIPEAEDVVVRLLVTDEARVEGEWVQLDQATAECVVPATLPKSFFEEAPVSGVIPQAFHASGGDFLLSVSPLDRNGDLIIDGLDNTSVRFLDVVVSPLGSPGNIVSTGKANLKEVEVIKPSAPGEGVSVAITLDATGSMRSNDPQRLRVGAAQTLVERLTNHDVAAVLEFALDSTPYTPGLHGSRLLQGFTDNHALLDDAINRIGAGGSTPLYDALLDAVELLVAESSLPNPAVVLLTDGLENASTVATFDSAVEAAVLAKIPVFPIGLGVSVDFSRLQEMAQTTGGTFASALNPEELQALFDALGTAVTVGRVVVNAQMNFDTPVPAAGIYTVSGSIEMTIDNQTRESPFSFQVTIGNPPIAKALSAELEMLLTEESP